MTPVKWYLLYVTGSLNRANTYVQKYTEESERRGVVAMSCSWAKSPRPKISPMASEMSLPLKAKKRSIRRSTGKKLSKKIKATKTVPVNTCSSGARVDSPSIPDSPQMREFFAEVRQRQLRDYYLRMKAGERCSRAPAVCPNWEPCSHNIYCSGAKSMKKIQNKTMNKACNRYGDSAWR
ncbi:hypothetical protein KR059_005377 [Drosophila kikkawai]|nr:hypothetical protein KR059_005377 [Drosophila kikkawai]